MAKLKEKIELKAYIVAFFDLLSQRDKLEKAQWVPDEAGMERFRDDWKDIISKLRDFRLMFETSLKTIETALSEPNPKYTDEQNEKLGEMTNVPIKSQMFSDSVILFAEIPGEPARDAIAIEKMLVTCEVIFGTAISKELVFRGGIEFGLGAEIFEDDAGLYGPALYHAHKMESQAAKYPRVVIGVQLPGFLKHIIAEAANHEHEQLAKNTANRCLNMIATDVDGVTVLDYARRGSMNVFPDDELKKAIRFAQAEWARFREGRNQKLAGRYYMLLKYLEDRLSARGRGAVV